MSAYLNIPVPRTNDKLADLMHWLNSGIYVVLHNHKIALCYHACSKTPSIKEEEIRTFFETHKVVHLDISSDESLFMDTKWPAQIKKGGFNRCACELQNRAIWHRKIPHVETLQLS